MAAADTDDDEESDLDASNVSTVSSIHSTYRLVSPDSGFRKVLHRDRQDPQATPTTTATTSATRQRPRKPKLTPTTTTPFEVIDITGNISKCAGCWGLLKAGPSPSKKGKDPLDEKVCVRHKEHDFFFHQQSGEFRPKFEHKHYHINIECITKRNPHFDPSNAVIMLKKQPMNKAFNIFMRNRFM